MLSNLGSVMFSRRGCPSFDCVSLLVCDFFGVKPSRFSSGFNIWMDLARKDIGCYFIDGSIRGRCIAFCAENRPG
jgi:hypothetical protein